MLDQLVPFGTEAEDLFMIPRPDATEFTVEKLDSGEASLRDGFEIGRDSFVGDVTSNVVEPGLRSGWANARTSCSLKGAKSRLLSGMIGTCAVTGSDHSIPVMRRRADVNSCIFMIFKNGYIQKIFVR